MVLDRRHFLGHWSSMTLESADLGSIVSRSQQAPGSPAVEMSSWTLCREHGLDKMPISDLWSVHRLSHACLYYDPGCIWYHTVNGPRGDCLLSVVMKYIHRSLIVHDRSYDRYLL